MGISIDKAFGIHQEALRVYSKRAELLANNIANADTPGFKAKDLDFQGLLQGYQKQGAAAELTHHKHDMGLNESSLPLNSHIITRTAEQPSQDGNTVNSAKEQMNYANNAMRYQISLQFLSGRIKGLLSALKGE